MRMKCLTSAFALAMAVPLCSLGAFSAPAHAQNGKVVRKPSDRLVVVRTPVLTPTPWDYNIVPRYRYRPEDDKVDPYGPPPVPVIRFGAQEETLRPWPWY
jgi:hypothetical protein